MNPLVVTTRAFDKTPRCVDILSFDPGLRNGGVVHVRVDQELRRCCILHAAIIDVLDPSASFRKAPPHEANSRKKKPDKVEPFSDAWPDEPDFAFELSAEYRARVTRALEAEQQKKLTFPERVPLFSWALASVNWLNGTDPSLDVVLVEVQDPQNPQMRALGHAVQTFYETLNARSPDRRQLRVEYVSSRLKLSDAVLMSLDESLHFENGRANDESTLAELVSRRSHAAKKSSAVQVFKALQERAPVDHPFFDWAEKQRTTKHNVLDALLQTWSWMLETGVGFDSAQLTLARKQRQRSLAAARRERARQHAPDERAVDEVAVDVQSAPKRRRVERAVVAVDLS